MSDYSKVHAAARKRMRKRRWENRLVTLLAVVAGAGALFVLVLTTALYSAVGIYLGWNLGVYGLAHAVHTNVSHIGFWTAFGTGFAIGVLRRVLSGEATVTQRLSQQEAAK